MFILLILVHLVIFVKCLDFTYFFQIKEYRMDRSWSAITEFGWMNVLYTLSLKRPAISVRNILILLLCAAFLIILFLSALEVNLLYIGLALVWPIIPPVACVLVSIAVLLTELPSRCYRYSIVLRAMRKVKQSKARFIGVTGSYGKTSVKEYLALVLSSKYKTAKTPLNMNTDIGIALSILSELSDSTEYFIVELGAYRSGEIARASHYIPFDIVILTGLGNQHVDLYGSRKELIAEETWPLTRPSSNGVVYVPADQHDWLTVKAQVRASIRTYGKSRADVKLSTIKRLSPQATHFSLSIGTQKYSFQTKLPGDHSVLNLLPVIDIALRAQIPYPRLKECIANLSPLKGKLSFHVGKHRSSFLHDGVNSNREGFLSAIGVLASYPHKKKFIITQGIRELGREKGSTYQTIVRAAAQEHIKLFSTDPAFKMYDTTETVMIFNDVKSMITHLISSADAHTITLIEGKFSSQTIQLLL